MVPILVHEHRLALPLRTVVGGIAGLNTELELAIAIYQPQLLNTILVHQHGTATNYYGNACLCSWHPCAKDTISFRWIVSQHCCFMIVGMMYCRRLRDKSNLCWRCGKLPISISYSNISVIILQHSSSSLRSLRSHPRTLWRDALGLKGMVKVWWRGWEVVKQEEREPSDLDLGKECRQLSTHSD